MRLIVSGRCHGVHRVTAHRPADQGRSAEIGGVCPADPGSGDGKTFAPADLGAGVRPRPGTCGGTFRARPPRRSQRRSTGCTCSAPTSSVPRRHAARTARPATAGRGGPARRRARRASRSAPRRRAPRRSPGRTPELTMMSAVCGKRVGAAYGVGGARARSRRAGRSSITSVGVERDARRRTGPAPPRRAPRCVPAGSRCRGGWRGCAAARGGGASISSRLIRPGTSGKETRPRFPEASTIGSEPALRPVLVPPSSTGRCSAARGPAARGLGAARGYARPGAARAARSRRAPGRSRVSP